jgi:nitrite reductase/ring-hydroxylating ferredoxin subunit
MFKGTLEAAQSRRSSGLSGARQVWFGLEQDRLPRARIGELSMSRFVKLTTLSELPEGSAAEFEFEGRVYALYNIKGAISAIDGICPHQGGPLAEGLLEGTTVTCPWHGWQFDVCTGKTPLGPKIKQPVYEVKVEGEDVLVLVP